MRGDSGYAYLPAGQAEVEFAKYRRQVEALQAEIDRMRPVVNAVIEWRHRGWYGKNKWLETVIDDYEASNGT